RLLFDDAKGVGEVLNETICGVDDCKGWVNENNRRLLFDDAKGVGDVLNETICGVDDCKGWV
nr:alpha-mannosidase At3g26720-like [Tanacetum cinerariifolium]GFC60859.1 alpha-mannosidase At3g26720-like [Tanacetum cinerariifolium]